jgi:cytoskeleton protein RodZ
MSVRNRQSMTGVPPPGGSTTVDERAHDAQAADATSEGGGQMTLPLSRDTDVTRAAEAYEMNEFNPETVRDEGAVAMIGGGEGDASLGQRLRAGREARGWSRADVAARLKLPLNLVGKLESDDYEGLTQGVFLRGYLGSYARLVEVPIEAATTVAAAHSQPAPLVATGTISRSRYLFDRYSVSATYLILTAIIVVPAVWLATHGGLEQNLARTTPLDPPANVSVPLQSGSPDAATTNPAEANPADGAVASTAGETATAPVALAPPAPVEQAPVIASMTPFTTAPSAPAAEPPKPAEDAAGTGAHTLQLKLSQASWVEILGANGQRLEYGTLTAGSERSYRSDGPLSVRLGNVQGAEVRSDGKLVDLVPFQRGNVAHVKLFDGNASRVEQQ